MENAYRFLRNEKQDKKVDYTMVVTNQNYIPVNKPGKAMALLSLSLLLFSLPHSFLPSFLNFLPLTYQKVLSSYSMQTPCSSPN